MGTDHTHNILEQTELYTNTINAKEKEEDLSKIQTK